MEMACTTPEPAEVAVEVAAKVAPPPPPLATYETDSTGEIMNNNKNLTLKGCKGLTGKAQPKEWRSEGEIPEY